MKQRTVPLFSDFFDVTAEIVEAVDPLFYKDPITAAMKGLGII